MDFWIVVAVAVVWFGWQAYRFVACRLPVASSPPTIFPQGQPADNTGCTDLENVDCIVKQLDPKADQGLIVALSLARVLAALPTDVRTIVRGKIQWETPPTTPASTP